MCLPGFIIYRRHAVKPAIHISILQLPTCGQLHFELATQMKSLCVCSTQTVGNTFASPRPVGGLALLHIYRQLVTVFGRQPISVDITVHVTVRTTAITTLDIAYQWFLWNFTTTSSIRPLKSRIVDWRCKERVNVLSHYKTYNIM